MDANIFDVGEAEIGHSAPEPSLMRWKQEFL